MKKEESFFVNRVKSIGFAFNGALHLLKTEKSIQLQVIIGIVMTILGFYFELSNIEWTIQCLTIGSILTIEGINTAIEEIADFIHPEHHSKIGQIKDISAGAVFIMAIIAIIVGMIIYLPKIF